MPRLSLLSTDPDSARLERKFGMGRHRYMSLDGGPIRWMPVGAVGGCVNWMTHLASAP